MIINKLGTLARLKHVQSPCDGNARSSDQSWPRWVFDHNPVPLGDRVVRSDGAPLDVNLDVCVCVCVCVCVFVFVCVCVYINI